MPSVSRKPRVNPALERSRKRLEAAHAESIELAVERERSLIVMRLNNKAIATSRQVKKLIREAEAATELATSALKFQVAAVELVRLATMRSIAAEIVDGAHRRPIEVTHAPADKKG